MAKGVNKVILVGHLGREPEMHAMPSGSSVATVSLATNYSTKNQQTGEWREETDWHRVVFFDRLAEIAKQYLQKGRLIYVEGRLKTRKWQDQNTGQDRYTTEVVARDLQMLDSRDNMNASNYSQPAGNYPPYGSQPGGYTPQQPGGYTPQQPGGYSPQQPGGYSPQQPGGYTPQQPGGYTPQQPGGYSPQQPGGYTPQPGSYSPPQQPGSYTPPQGNPDMEPTSPPYDTGGDVDTQNPASPPHSNDEGDQSQSPPATPPNPKKPPESNFDQDVPF
jgi:single-strand DNA-binding protein